MHDMCLLEPIILLQPVVTVTEMLRKRDQEIVPAGLRKAPGSSNGGVELRRCCGSIAARDF